VELQFNVTMAGTLLTTVAVRKGDETPVLGSPFFGTAAAAAAAVLPRSTVTGPGTVMARVGGQATVAVSLFDAYGNRLTHPSQCAGVSLRFFHGVGAHANEPGLEVREFPSNEKSFASLAFDLHGSVPGLRSRTRSGLVLASSCDPGAVENTHPGKPRLPFSPGECFVTAVGFN
jgi:hypothetical protein